MTKLQEWFLIIVCLAAAIGILKSTAHADAFPTPGHGQCFARFYHEGDHTSVASVVLELRAPRVDREIKIEYDFDYRVAIQDRGYQANTESGMCSFIEGTRRAPCFGDKIGDFELSPSNRHHGSLVLRPNLYQADGRETPEPMRKHSTAAYRLDPAPAIYCLQLPAQ